MRPMLKPVLARVWRDRSTLQLGTDPTRSVVLAGVTAHVLRVIELLDGTRDLPDLLGAAEAAGVEPAFTREVVDRLGSAGVLDDAGADTAVLRALAGRERDGMAAELAALSLLRPAPGAALGALARRRAGHVAVVGTLPLCRQVEDALLAAGVGTVTRHTRPAALLSVPRPHRPELVVVAAVAAVPAETTDVLLRLAVPHLAVVLRDLTGVVGPLVLPGVTSCLRCLDLHRADRDPAWPVVAMQLESTVIPTPPYSAALGHLLAGTTALQVLGHLDGDRPATADGTLEIALPDWRLRRRSWLPHPDCGCGLGCVKTTATRA